MDGRFEDIAVRVGEEYAAKLVKDIENGDSTSVVFALFVAVMLDVLTLFSSVTPLASFISFFGAVILTFILWDAGSFIKMKVRLIIWIAAAIEIIPIIGFMPIWTIALIWAIFVIKGRAREADAEASAIVAEPLPDIEVEFN